MSVAAVAVRAVFAVLLVILAAVLLLLLALLLCPVRYELVFAAEYPDQKKEENVFLALFDTAMQSRKTAQVRFSWFLHLVRGELSYPESPQLVLSIFGKEWKPFEDTEEEEWQPSPDNEAQIELERLRAQREESEKSGSDRTAEGPCDTKRTDGRDTDASSQDRREKEKGSEKNAGGRMNPDESQIGKVRKKVRRAAENLQYKIQELSSSLRRLLHRAEDFRTFISAQTTQRALSRMTGLLRMLLRRYLPDRWEIRGKVGLGDPSWTGKMLEAAGYSYPLTGGHMYIEPDFSGVYCDVKGYAQGKIRLIFLAAAAIRAALDKNVRVCWKQIRGR